MKVEFFLNITQATVQGTKGNGVGLALVPVNQMSPTLIVLLLKESKRRQLKLYMLQTEVSKP